MAVSTSECLHVNVDLNLVGVELNLVGTAVPLVGTAVPRCRL